MPTDSRNLPRGSIANPRGVFSVGKRPIWDQGALVGVDLVADQHAVRELEGALNRITAQMRLVGGESNLESAQELLRDLLRANARYVTIDEIQKCVAEHFNIKMAEMTSSRRALAVARPRQVAMYLAKRLTPRSLPEIGRKFGGRDHTTVMHAVRKIEELSVSDRALAEDVELPHRMLGN